PPRPPSPTRSVEPVRPTPDPAGPAHAALRAPATAAWALTSPAPSTFSRLPQSSAADTRMGVAVVRRIWVVKAMLPMSLGLADHINATTPATCGAAIDVPVNRPYVLSGRAERTRTPGAIRSGLARPSAVGPALENNGIPPSRAVAPTVVTSA